MPDEPRYLRRLIGALRGPRKHIEVSDGTFWLAWGDGRHNDAPMLQHAIDHAKLSSGTVFLPRGNYRIPRTIDLT